jgi:hypothetical protein
MTLTPEIVARLQTLQSLLELRDFELVETIALRLEVHRGHDGISEVLESLADRRYAETIAMVAKLLSEGTRLVRWTDPEVALLEAELEQLAAELAELETEQAEIGHLLTRFQTAFDRALGDRIARLLKLRMEARQRRAEAAPHEAETRSEYEEARRDYEQHRAEEEVRREAGEKAEWNLSEEEEQELKRLYRAAAKRCHPDAVAEEHVEAATAMFRELNEAYQAGDLDQIRRIAERVAAGLFETEGRDENPERRKERLRARIAAVRESLAQTRAELEALKESPSYQSAVGQVDWCAYFEEQGRLLDRQIEQLSGTES